MNCIWFSVFTDCIELFQVHNEIRRCWNRHRRHDSVFTRTFSLSTYKKGSCLTHNQNTSRSSRHHFNHDGSTVSEQTNDGHSSIKCKNGAPKTHYQASKHMEQMRPLMD